MHSSGFVKFKLRIGLREWLDPPERSDHSVGQTTNVVSRAGSGEVQVGQGHISFWRVFEQLWFCTKKLIQTCHKVPI